MQKSIWIFGILAGTLCALLEFLFFKSTGGSANVMYITKLAILLVSVSAGVILTRKLLGGQISIARTLLTGLLVSAVRAAVMIVAFLYLYQPNGDFYKQKLSESYSQAELKVAQDDKIKPADKPMELAIIKSQISSQYEPNGYTLMAIGSSLVSGLIISIFLAAFLSTNMMYQKEE